MKCKHENKIDDYNFCNKANFYCTSYIMDRCKTNHPEYFGEDKVKKINNDNVNHPNHYQGKNECIDVMIAMFGKEAVKHFCMCNAYKYRFRSNMKNGEEDIKKAEWYEDKIIELGGTE